MKTALRSIALVTSCLLLGCCGEHVDRFRWDAGSEVPSCTTVEDCQFADRPCLIASCDERSGQCNYAVIPGACWVDEICHEPGPSPSNPCRICDPSLLRVGFVTRVCEDGSYCDSDIGGCQGTADVGRDSRAPDVPEDTGPGDVAP